MLFGKKQVRKKGAGREETEKKQGRNRKKQGRNREEKDRYMHKTHKNRQND